MVQQFVLGVRRHVLDLTVSSPIAWRKTQLAGVQYIMTVLPQNVILVRFCNTNIPSSVSLAIFCITTTNCNSNYSKSCQHL